MVFSCDYNGWADLPEEEREALETFEAGLQPGLTAQPVGAISARPPVLAPAPQRRAA